MIARRLLSLLRNITLQSCRNSVVTRKSQLGQQAVEVAPDSLKLMETLDHACPLAPFQPGLVSLNSMRAPFQAELCFLKSTRAPGRARQKFDPAEATLYRQHNSGTPILGSLQRTLHTEHQCQALMAPIPVPPTTSKWPQSKCVSRP